MTSTLAVGDRGTGSQHRARSGRPGSLVAGLDILETLAQNPDGLGVTAIARSLGMDKGNTHRLLRVLDERGYVQQDQVTKAYNASAQLVALAGHLLRGLDLVSASRPIMQDLSLQTGEAVHLARRTKSGAVYVARERQGGGAVTVETEIGAQPVIHVTATGKAIYCLSTKEELQQVVQQPLTAYTNRSITSLEVLVADLQKVRERGYAMDDGELDLHVRCVAAPIFDIFGVPTGCIGLSGPADRVTLADVDELGRMVGAASIRITTEMGGHVPATFGVHPTSLREVPKDAIQEYTP